MRGIINIGTQGTTIFGALFPLLFVLAYIVLFLIIHDLLCRITRTPLAPDRAQRACSIEGFCTLAVLTGSLQTIISLCIVGFSLWSGQTHAGVKAFSALIQGFASTGFGVAVNIVGRLYLQLGFRRQTSKGEI